MHRLIVTVAVTSMLLMTSGPSGAITYGHVDGDLHPNVGSLIAKNRHGKWVQWCTGAMVSDRVFLTAAHCVQGEDPERFSVTFDPVLSQDMATVHGVAHYDHRAYTQGTSRPHDIAVMVLDHAVGVQPVQLPRIGLLDDLKASHDLRGRLVTAVGYGTRRTTQQGGPKSILPNRKRRYALQHVKTIQSQWVSLDMNPATGNAGTCYGDSGGPHFLGGVNSNVEVALTVFGDAVCKAVDKDFRLDTKAAQNYIGRFVDLG
jgi:secreted trypsin-like serine protease